MDTKKTIRTALSIINVCGIVGTAVVAVHDTKKADKTISKIDYSGSKITKLDLIKAVWKDYIPTVLVASATVASSISGSIMSKKAEASLIGVISMAEYNYQKYKSKVKQVLGKDAADTISKELVKDEYNSKRDEIIAKCKNEKRSLYYIENIGFFLADDGKVGWAISNLNENLSCCGYYSSGIHTFVDLLNDMDAELLDKTLDKAYLNFGWSIDYLSEIWDCVWVHAYTVKMIDNNDNIYYELRFGETPIYSPGDWYSWAVEHELNINEYLEGAPCNYEKEIEYSYRH